MSNDEYNRSLTQQLHLISANQRRMFRQQATMNRSLPHLIQFFRHLQSLTARRGHSTDDLVLLGVKHGIDEILLQIGAIPPPDAAQLKIKLDFLAEFEGPSAPCNLNLLPMLIASAETDILRFAHPKSGYWLDRTLH